MFNPINRAFCKRVALLVLSGVTLCAFLGLSLHVVLDAAHHLNHHAHHHGHAHGDHDHDHGGGSGGSHVPHDCPHCALLGALAVVLWVAVGLLPVTAVKLPLPLAAVPRKWNVSFVHPLRGPPPAHPF